MLWAVVVVVLVFLFRIPLIRAYHKVQAPRRLAKWREYEAWRKTLKSGDRVWVIGPRENTFRMTIRDRDGDRVNLLQYVDSAGDENCWIGVRLVRLFPNEPTSWEVELALAVEGELYRA